MSRILKTGNVQITQGYKKGTHDAVDLVKSPSKTDTIKAHSAGTVIFCQTGQKNNKGSSGNASYGNCIKIQHANGYCTLYAHLASVSVKLNQQVAQGQDIGVMGNTGNSYGAHLHFEVWKDNKRIDPTPYLESNFPALAPANKITVTYKTHDKKKKQWLPAVVDASDYAGNYKNELDGLSIKLSSGTIYYAVHQYKGGWLPAVSGYNTSDNNNGYAGNLGKPIDAIMMRTTTSKKINYRVHILGGGWLPWVSGCSTTDYINGFAGNIGQKIDAVQIKLV